MLLKSFIIAVFLILSNFVSAQKAVNKTFDEKIEITHNDTVFKDNIEPAYFFFPSKETNAKAKEIERNIRLIRNVKKAYYYARIANERLKKVDQELQKIDNKKQRKEYLDKAEKELKAEFEDELKKLTITQGRILIKLIDRETGNTTYYLVKEMRGAFSAIFWQSVARIFGSNLKSQYDPKGEDKEIEAIIQMIDKGLL